MTESGRCCGSTNHTHPPPLAADHHPPPQCVFCCPHDQCPGLFFSVVIVPEHAQPIHFTQNAPAPGQVEHWRVHSHTRLRRRRHLHHLPRPARVGMLVRCRRVPRKHNACNVAHPACASLSPCHCKTVAHDSAHCSPRAGQAEWPIGSLGHWVTGSLAHWSTEMCTKEGSVEEDLWPLGFLAS